MSSKSCENCSASLRNMATYCSRCGAPQPLESTEVTLSRDVPEVTVYGVKISLEALGPAAPNEPTCHHLGLPVTDRRSGGKHQVTAMLLREDDASATFIIKKYPAHIDPSRIYKRDLEAVQRKMQAAIDLVKKSDRLDARERKQFSESIPSLTADTPAAQVAGSRVARLLPKLGKATGQALRDILVQVASETAKKMIWPRP